MSSESAGGDESFEDRLEAMYERYRRRSIGDKLEDIAEEMEDTLLQQAMAEAFFDERLEIDSDAKAAVEELRAALGEGNYETVENKLDNVETAVETAAAAVETEIQRYQLEMLSTVQAMERLNERVNRVNEVRLQSLRQLLEDWNWEMYLDVDDDAPFEHKREEAQAIGQELVETFEELKEKLFGPYKGTELWHIVEQLLDEERLTYAALTPDERELLAESDLTEYVELSLS
jgi:hypothetical protein